LRELHKTPELAVDVKKKGWSVWGMWLELIKNRWLRRCLKVSQKVEEKWEGPYCEGWRM
jgi:hypothetical protein